MFCCCPGEVDSDDNTSLQDKKTECVSDNGKTQSENNREVIQKDQISAEEIQEGSSHLNTARPPEGDSKSEGFREENLVPVDSVESAEEVMSAEALSSAVNRLEAVASRLESLAGRSAAVSSRSSSESDTLTPSVVAYDEILNNNVAKFVELSQKIGGDAKTMAGLVQKAFNASRDFVLIASKSKKPTDDLMNKLLKPLSDAIQDVVQFRESNRPSPQINHLSAVSEAIPALGWVSVAPTPGPYVKEMQDAGMFYTNRVLKDFKDKDQTHVDWVKAWLSTFTVMQGYIKEHHTTGLTWNPQGGVAAPATAAKPNAGGAPVPPPPGAPPPPPPPPPPPAEPAPSAGDGDSGDRSALFAELNKGTDITKGLKKVTDDMKTHKNPTLRQGPAPFKAAASTPKPYVKPTTTPVAKAVEQKPPVFELQNKKWVIEHQVGNKTMTLDDANLKQVVYMYKCVDSALVVKGKVNSIILDSCKKVGVAFDDVVASIEFINCQSVQGQVFGKVPTVSIDKTDGCQMYLSKDSLDTEIVTAKSSEMNILVPKGEGDFTEFPIPEQFKTTYNGKAFVTGPTDSV